MENKNANDPINPITNETHDYLGLTKREYFAAMAMQGLLANGFPDQVPEDKFWHEMAAHDAISCADKLLKQLNK